MHIAQSENIRFYSNQNTNYHQNNKQFNYKRNEPTGRACKFYIRGNCRYGNQCKFKHTNDNVNSMKNNNVEKQQIICKKISK